MRYLYRILFFVLFLALPPFNLALAEITISPAIIEQAVEPGASYNFSLNITNHDGSPEDLFYADVHNIKNVTEFGEPIFSDDIGEKTGFEMASWIEISAGAVRVKKDQTKSLPFTVLIPKNASPGWHAAAIFIGNNPSKANGVNTSSIDYKTAVIISFRVAGAVSDELQINKFSTGGYIFPSPNVNFEVTLENTGNALQRPIGVIEITDHFGQKVVNINLNEKQNAVIPGGLRTFNSSWEGDRMSFGRYKASLALSYGFENSYKTAARETYFWILPAKIISLTVGTLLLLALLIYIFVKVYVKRKIQSITSGKSIKTANKISRLLVMTLVSLAFAIIFALILFVIFS
jgi:hypothetical protein